ncbi:hypothetical protein HDU86_000529 [Geranomyces michiganensis]|nr:hypothetical protein HDU86_000529 [Geranomyces michiganensis]
MGPHALSFKNSFDLVLDVHTSWNFFSGAELWAVATTSAGAHLVIDTKLKAKLIINALRTIFETPEIEYPLAQTGLVIVPKFTLKAGFRLDMRGSIDLKAGAQWDARATTPINIFKSSGVQASATSTFKPVFDLKAQVSATANLFFNPIITLQIRTPWNVAGVALTIDGNLQTPMSLTSNVPSSSDPVKALTGENLKMSQCALVGGIRLVVKPYIQASGWVVGFKATTDPLYFPRPAMIDNGNPDSFCVNQKDVAKVPRGMPTFKPTVCRTQFGSAVTLKVNNKMRFPVNIFYISSACEYVFRRSLRLQTRGTIATTAGSVWVAYNAQQQFVNFFAMDPNSTAAATWVIDKGVPLPAATTNPTSTLVAAPAATTLGPAPEIKATVCRTAFGPAAIPMKFTNQMKFPVEIFYIDQKCNYGSRAVIQPNGSTDIVGNSAGAVWVAHNRNLQFLSFLATDPRATSVSWIIDKAVPFPAATTAAPSATPIVSVFGVEPSTKPTVCRKTFGAAAVPVTFTNKMSFGVEVFYISSTCTYSSVGVIQSNQSQEKIGNTPGAMWLAYNRNHNFVNFFATDPTSITPVVWIIDKVVPMPAA